MDGQHDMPRSVSRCMHCCGEAVPLMVGCPTTLGDAISKPRMRCAPATASLEVKRVSSN